jgi:hypothetical protein
MIYEIALLPVRPESVETFKRAFAEVAPLVRFRVVRSGRTA